MKPVNMAMMIGVACSLGAIRTPSGQGWMTRAKAARSEGVVTPADEARIHAAEDKRAARAAKRARVAGVAPLDAEPLPVVK